MKKVITKCKSDSGLVAALQKQLAEKQDEIDALAEKFKKSHEAQKLAEVKVMELEQRLATLQEKADSATADAEKHAAKLSDATRLAKELGRKTKELEKEKKNADAQLKQLLSVSEIRVKFSFKSLYQDRIP